MNVKELLEQMIAEGHTRQVIQELLEATKRNGQKDLFNDLLLLSGRYLRNEREKDLMDSREYRVELNKIVASMTAVLERYKDDGSIRLSPVVHDTPKTEEAPDNFVPLPEQPVVRVQYEEEHFNDIEPLIAQGLVLLVTATAMETKALHQQMMPLTERRGLLEIPKNNATYYIGKFGNFAVAHVECGAMGALAVGGATMTINNAIQHLKPRFVLMAGIAFGIDATKQNIGDVLVSEAIIPYEIQRISEDNNVWRGVKPEASNMLRNAFKNLRDWEYQLPNGQMAQMEFCDILTGEKLVDNLNFRTELKRQFPTVKGGEMEGAGLYAACHDKRLDWILVKSICDFADGQKRQGKKEKQELAIDTALSVCLCLFNRKHRFEELGVKPYE